jgi:LCP family protein required for cell wall assembly
VEGVTEVPQNMKINEAFRIGYYAGGIENGADLAAEAVAHVTGLRVDGWIIMDFQGFQAMVDAIGGITVDNPTAFTYTWAEEDYLARNFQFEFPAGRLELDATHAIDYARNRYTIVSAESSVFARLVRQQRVLQAIRGEMSGLAAVGKGLAVADSLVGHLHTNLSVLDLAMLAGKIDIDRRLELSEGVTLEATTNTVGQYVLAVIGRRGSADYQPLHDYISSSLTSEVAASVP